MGSIITKILDDYHEYKQICHYFNEEPIDIEKFYDHEEIILKSNGFDNKYKFEEFLRKNDKKQNNSN